MCMYAVYTITFLCKENERATQSMKVALAVILTSRLGGHMEFLYGKGEISPGSRLPEAKSSKPVVRHRAFLAIREKSLFAHMPFL